MNQRNPEIKERVRETKKTTGDKRANSVEKPMEGKRARLREKTKSQERAIAEEKPSIQKRANVQEEKPGVERTTPEDVLAVRTLVRAREDFQAMRKKMDNRLGRKANGEDQELVETRSFRGEDNAMFITVADASRNQEKEIQKMLRDVLRRFPIYTEYLEGIKGIGEIAAGWIIGEFDIHKASTVSKLWQFCGLNPGMVRGNKAIDKKKYKPTMGEIIKEYTTKLGEEKYLVATNEMIKGDKLTEGFTSPFNKNLRTALVGVMADGFIKQQNHYCMNFYYPYKARLENETNTVTHLKKDVEWKDVSKGHRDRAAKRYMIKMFLKDLYVAWRTLEGLEVRAPYQEEYLGHKHGGKK